MTGWHTRISAAATSRRWVHDEQDPRSSRPATVPTLQNAERTTSPWRGLDASGPMSQESKESEELMSCACRWLDDDQERSILPSDQCAECLALSDRIEPRAMQALDLELDQLVIAHAGGKRVKSLMPADPYKDVKR